MTLVLGMDIGGTCSRARLATAEGTIVAEAEAASASLTAAGPARAATAVDELLAALGLRGPAGAPGLSETADVAVPRGHQSFERLGAICVGTAGSGSPASVEWFEQRLAPLTATNTIMVVNDSRLALPAAGLDEGIAVVSGTGSTAVGVLSGREERAGGWGYLLGDEGSGYWIAREGIRRILARHDDHDDLGPLGAALLDESAAGAADPFALLHRFHELPSPDRWARLAPLVLDCGDPASGEIADAAAAALARLAAAVGRRLPGEVSDVVLAGGLLTNHGALAERTKAAIESKIRGALVCVVTEPPVAGAVRMALQAIC